MKKSFKWLWCASLLAGAFMVGCEKSHEHTYATTYTNDVNGHWIAPTCDCEDAPISNLSTHTGMEDGTCDVCAYDAHNGVGHTYATVLSYDETNHWYAPTCGHSVANKDVAPHVDENNDKACDDCGYDYNHTHTYATTWTGDVTHHWHAVTCECSIAVADKAEHVDADLDGVCDICTGNTFEAGHEHTKANDWSKDADGHWHAITCAHTGIATDKTAHVGMEDGVCNQCGWDVVEDGAHTHVAHDDWSKSETKHWKSAICGHTAVKLLEADHVDADNNKLCDVCEYDYQHVHTYSYDIAKDTTKHWISATCGCAADVLVENHVDNDNDGYCDICLFDEHQGAGHTSGEPDTFQTNETHHWVYTCGHTEVDAAYGEHVDDNYDGKCDVCERVADTTHTHALDDSWWNKDATNHWRACVSHMGYVFENTVTAHVDVKKYDEGTGEPVDGTDGYCDVCDARIMATFMEQSLTEAKKWAQMGTVTEDFGDSSRPAEIMYESGDGYYHSWNTYYNDMGMSRIQYWFVKNDDNTVFAVMNGGGGVELNTQYEDAGLSVLDGFRYEFISTENGDYTFYGAENAVLGLYKAGLTSGTNMTQYFNEDWEWGGYDMVPVYSCSFAYDFEYNDSAYRVEVAFVLRGSFVYNLSTYDYDEILYLSSATMNFDSEYNPVSFEVTQFGGERTAQALFTADDFNVQGYKLMYDGAEVTSATNLTFEKGSTNSIEMTYEDVQSATGNFNFDLLTFTATGTPTVADAYYPTEYVANEYGGVITLDVGAFPVGTYTISYASKYVTKTFTLTITVPAVTSITPVIDTYGYGFFNPIAEGLNLYVNDVITIAADVNQYANPAYTYAITSGDGTNVEMTVLEGTKTENGADAYTAKFTAAGTYVITFTSTEASTVSTTLTVTVTTPPTVAEALAVGEYFIDKTDYTEGATNVLYMTFTSTDDTTGTVDITVVTNKGETKYEDVVYVYAEGVFTLTKDGNEFTDVTLSWNATSYVLEASFTGWGYSWDYDLNEAVWVDTLYNDTLKPYSVAAMVMGKYQYTKMDEYYTSECQYAIVLGEDGKGTYTKLSDYSMDTWSFTTVEAEEEFTYSVTDDGDGTYTLKIETAEGDSLSVGATYSIEVCEVNYTTDLAIVNIVLGGDTVTLGIYR